MRELKFRVWDDDINDWHATKAIAEFADKYNKGYDFNIVCFGDPKRADIEQYTGLKDKNGKEIYEGDIVNADSRIYEVAWFEKDGGWFCFRENDSVYTPLYHLKCEVIGNIHENPELIKEG